MKAPSVATQADYARLFESHALLLAAAKQALDAIDNMDGLLDAWIALEAAITKAEGSAT